MKTFDVEVPVYLSVRVTAPSEDEAVGAAQSFVAEAATSPTNHGEAGLKDDLYQAVIHSVRLVELDDDEDSTPDVYEITTRERSGVMGKVAHP